MRKIIILITMMLLMLLVACETTKIVAPKGQYVVLASQDANCKLVKERKIAFLYGVPFGQEDVFSKLFEGVKNPVKVRIMSTFIDNMMGSSASDHSGRKVDIKFKTMKVYECTGGTATTNTNTQDLLKKEVKEEAPVNDTKKDTSEIVDEKLEKADKDMKDIDKTE